MILCELISHSLFLFHFEHFKVFLSVSNSSMWKCITNIFSYDVYLKGRRSMIQSRPDRDQNIIYKSSNCKIWISHLFSFANKRKIPSVCVLIAILIN